jgi:murein DD-endopeptidase MepM/ murein hydrolase activator NlpD
MSWSNPVPYKLVVTNDSDSFKGMKENVTGLPFSPHCGAFGAQRKYDIHQGIDLYVHEECPVYAVDDGVVKDVCIFTGEQIGMGWWCTTHAVTVKHTSGEMVLYGEIVPVVKDGDVVTRGQLIGTVTPVLKKDKGRPMSMLHLEVYENRKTVDPYSYLVHLTE